MKAHIERLLSHSHTHLSVVHKVLEWIATGELVHHLLAVGDGACARIQGVDHARDVDKLNAGKV